MNPFERFEELVPTWEAFHEERLRRKTDQLSEATLSVLYTLLAGFDGPGQIDLLGVDEAALRAGASLFEKALRRKGWFVRVTAYPARWYRAQPYVRVEC